MLNGLCLTHFLVSQMKYPAPTSSKAKKFVLAHSLQRFQSTVGSFQGRSGTGEEPHGKNATHLMADRKHREERGAWVGDAPPGHTPSNLPLGTIPYFPTPGQLKHPIMHSPSTSILPTFERCDFGWMSSYEPSVS